MMPRRLISLALFVLLWAHRSVAESRDMVCAFAGDLPKVSMRSPRIDYGIDVQKETFAIHVPANYDGSQPFGLIVFIPAAGLMVGAPDGWDRVLEERRLLLVAPQRAVNRLAEATRLGLGVIAALTQRLRYQQRNDSLSRDPVALPQGRRCAAKNLTAPRP